MTAATVSTPRTGMPKRTKRMRVPDQGWQDDAACQTAGPNTAAGLQGVETQVEGEHLAAAWCARCPVARACLETGIATHGWGVWGGLVLQDGRRAPERPTGRLEADDELADQLGAFLATRGGWWAGTADQLGGLLGVDLPAGPPAGQVVRRAAERAGVGLVPLQRPPGNPARRLLLTAADGPTVPTTTLAAEVYLALPAMVAERGGSWRTTATELASAFGTARQHVLVALRTVAPMLANRLSVAVDGRLVILTTHKPEPARLPRQSTQRWQPRSTTRAARRRTTRKRF